MVLTAACRPTSSAFFAGTANLGVWDGRRLSARLSGRTLQRALAHALLAVAAVMLLDAMV